MRNEKLDRYDCLVEVKLYDVRRGNFTIIEMDEKKGRRISLVNKDTGVLDEIREATA